MKSHQLPLRWLELTASSSHELAYRQVAAPRLGKEGIAVVSRTSGISRGTELRRLRGDLSPFVWDYEASVFSDEQREARWPLQLGYETVGEIVAVGSGLDPSLLGRMIWAPTNHAQCHVLDWQDVRHGLLPDGVTTDQWVEFSTVARGRIALAAVHDAEVSLGETIAIVGSGVVGYLAARLSVLAGAKEVFLLDINAENLRPSTPEITSALVSPDCSPVDVKRQMGGGSGADRVIECSGTYDGLNMALKVARKHGTVVTVGTYFGRPSLDMSAEWGRNRLTLISSMSVNECTNRLSPIWDRRRLESTVIDLLAARKLGVEGLPRRIFGFDRAAEAFSWLEGAQSTLNVVAFSYEDGNG